MAEFDGLVDFAALDQIGVRLKDRVEFFRCGNLFSVENAAACLIGDTITQRTIIEVFSQLFNGQRVCWSFCPRSRRPFQSAACIGQDFLSNRQQLPVDADLLAFTLSRRHALELLHPFARRSLAVGKTRHVFGNDRAQTPDQAAENPNRVPE